MRDVTDDGSTVLLSSHILAEVETLADRITIIRDDRRIESGTLTELRHLTRTSIGVRTVHALDGLTYSLRAVGDGGVLVDLCILFLMGCWWWQRWGCSHGGL